MTAAHTESRRFRRGPNRARAVVRAARALGASAALAAGVAAAGDAIVLRASVRMPFSAGEVRLADVAELVGPAAEALGGVVIATMRDDRAAVEVPVAEVRAILSESGANWSGLDLSGRSVVIRPRQVSGGPAPLAMAPVSIEPSSAAASRNAGNAPSAGGSPAPAPEAPEPPGQVAAAIMTSDTVRGAMARAIVAALRMAPEDVRLVFSDRDAAALDREGRGARFEVRPMTSVRSDRIEVQVREWAEGRIRWSGSFGVDLLLRLETASLRRDVSRGETLMDADVDAQRTWLSPSQGALLTTVAQAVGRVTARALRAGERLRAQHVRRESLIARGDPVIVRCLVGGVVISLQAEAREDGADGDRIELRKLGERQSFRATVTGPGEATLDLAGAAARVGGESS
jgi:flagella basal body P-ring formation protein FlgA